MSFQIEPYSIADFLEWHRTNRLRLNPDFQRRDVWEASERTLLIDTVLRGYSMPKVYFRTIIDPVTQQMVRDVVDGQQRLKAIIAFSDNKLKLGSKAEEFAGRTYKDLNPEDQQRFLQYRIATEQLINASDEYVSNIFTRLNQYGVKLNQAELRNAEFDNDFKWFVVEQSKKWWQTLLSNGFISLKQRSRMVDDEIIAELAQVHLRGVQGGDARTLRALYTHYDRAKLDKDILMSRMDKALEIVSGYSDIIPSVIKSRPHFVLLYAAITNAIEGDAAVKGQLSEGDRNAAYSLPKDGQRLNKLGADLLKIAEVITSDEVPEKDWERFYLASRSAPITIKSRRERFPTYANLFKEVIGNDD